MTETTPTNDVAELRKLRIIVPILARMHPATIRWLFQRLAAEHREDARP